MEEDFSKIMVFIDSSGDSLHAAEEGARLAAKFDGELHLLQLIHRHPIFHWLIPDSNIAIGNDIAESSSSYHRQFLNNLEDDLRSRYGVKTYSHSANGKIKDIINDLVLSNAIDLVVMGIQKKKSIKEILFGSLAEYVIGAINCEVLCVYPESDCSSLKKIVIPVGNSIPQRKIKLAYKLAKKFAANIHLVTCIKNIPSEKDTRVLMAAYQYVKDITNVPVICKTVSGSNTAKAVINYSKKIEADLILVNPGTESQIQGPVLRKSVSGIVNYSSIPVLSVHALAND